MRISMLAALCCLWACNNDPGGGADAGPLDLSGSASPDLSGGSASPDLSGSGTSPDLVASTSPDLRSTSPDLRSTSPDLRSSPDLLVCAPHNFYSESFDNGTPAEVTSGPFLLRWCHPYLPLASNTPLCEMGRTLRNNGGDQSAGPPGLWLSRGATGCSGVTLSYTYYQFALAGVTLGYQQSSDTTAQCPGFAPALTPAATHSALQVCTQKTVSIPFGNAASLYIFFAHDNSGMNAMWIDDLSITLDGCSC